MRLLFGMPVDTDGRQAATLCASPPIDCRCPASSGAVDLMSKDVEESGAVMRLSLWLKRRRRIGARILDAYQRIDVRSWTSLSQATRSKSPGCV